MIQIDADQLKGFIQQVLQPSYLLFGNDLFLLQESRDLILSFAKERKFKEHFDFTLDSSVDWEKIVTLCQTRSLFSSNQTLTLRVPNGVLNTKVLKKLIRLASSFHKELLLIIYCHFELTRFIKDVIWSKILRSRGMLVSCKTPTIEVLPRWVKKRAKNMKLFLDDQSCQLMCSFYEGNLLALAQALEKLSLTYPDKKLTLSRVSFTINNVAHFSVSHWIDAVLIGNTERAGRILRQLKLEATDPVLILRRIQKELKKLLQFKRKMHTIPVCKNFNYHKFRQDFRPTLTDALDRLTLVQLRNAFYLITRIELELKVNYNLEIWLHLKTLGLLLSGKSYLQL